MHIQSFSCTYSGYAEIFWKECTSVFVEDMQILCNQYIMNPLIKTKQTCTWLYILHSSMLWCAKNINDKIISRFLNKYTDIVVCECEKYLQEKYVHRLPTPNQLHNWPISISRIWQSLTFPDINICYHKIYRFRFFFFV